MKLVHSYFVSTLDLDTFVYAIDFTSNLNYSIVINLDNILPIPRRFENSKGLETIE